MNWINNINKKINRLRLFLSDSKSLLLSHHPLCQKYSNHVFHIKSYKFCIGCFTFFPSAITTLLFVFLFIDMNTTSSISLFLISCPFLSTYILTILGITRKKIIRIISKISIGIGAGLYISSLLAFPLPLFLKALILIESYSFIGIIAYYRKKEIEKKCLGCEYRKDWHACPGMKDIFDLLVEHGFKERKDV
jgi:hypothetical protein